MFPWRRRNEGFEWREYVRTTILVRRKDRREKLSEAKDAAIFGVRQAGRRGFDAGTESASAAGRTIGAAMVWLASVMMGLLRRLGSILAAAGMSAFSVLRPIPVRMLAGLKSVLAPIASRVGKLLHDALEPVVMVLLQPRVRAPLLIAGALAGLTALARAVFVVADGEALLAALITLVAFGLTFGATALVGEGFLPIAAARDALLRLGNMLPRLPGLDRLAPLQAGGIVAAVAAVLITTGAWWLAANNRNPADAAAVRVAQAEATEFEGIGLAVSGDVLKVKGAVLHLAGIEAPESEQECARPDGRVWKCGEAAKDTMTRIMRGKRVVCAVASRPEPETILARCTADGADIADLLVRGGHVFASNELFASYASAERDAAGAGAGLWSGVAERPSEYRAKKWDEAKRTAPDGCPIKGRVSEIGRVYVLPWSPSYDRVKVRTAKGERWFCSEDEARAAGWKPTTRL